MSSSNLDRDTGKLPKEKAFYDATGEPASGFDPKGKKPKDDSRTAAREEPEIPKPDDGLRDRVGAMEGAVDEMRSMMAALLKVNRELVKVQKQAATPSPAWPSMSPGLSGAPLFRTPDTKVQVSVFAQDVGVDGQTACMKGEEENKKLSNV
ncbi:hypothetical protein LPJ73_001926, partial [Coemansia sp. RSA 2703]